MLAPINKSVLVATLLLVACGTSPKPSFYTLSSESIATSGNARVQAYTLSVGPLTLPGALDRPQLVVRKDANIVEINEFQRWAAPLQPEMTRVLAEDLAKVLGLPRVLTQADSGAGNADYRVAIDVQRFDITPGGGAQLELAWTVRHSSGAQRSGHAALEEPVQDKGYDVLVAAQSRMLAKASQAIAQDVKALADSQPAVRKD